MNKIISFVLGLIVVIVFLLIVTGRFKIFNSRWLNISRGNTASPTPTKVAETGTPSPTVVNTTPAQKSPTPTPTQPIKSIPSTGSSTYVFVTAFILLLGGVFITSKSSI